jgi:hypothetical protein
MVGSGPIGDPLPVKTAGLALFLTLAAVPAFADPIAAKDATDHVGATATVEGRVGVTRMASGEIYLDLDGANQDAPLSGYISRWNAAKFPNVGDLDGKIVDITGAIATFRKRPEIFLIDPSQIAAK